MMQMVAILTVLSVAPGLLIMVTSFTRFIVALSFLRSGLGLQSAPANLVLISLSLFMTFFVMAPTFDRAWQDGLKPMMDNEITQQDRRSPRSSSHSANSCSRRCAKRTWLCSRTCRRADSRSGIAPKRT